MHSGTSPPPGPSTAPPRRTQPDQESQKLYNSWLALIPTLIPAYLGYMQDVQGRTGQPLEQQTSCRTGRCAMEESSILCLHFDCECVLSTKHYKRHGYQLYALDLVSRQMQYCACACISQVLVRNGLFPASPSAPRVAISIDLLDFYFALFERSADAITALAGALKTMYVGRGFPVLNEKVCLPPVCLLQYWVRSEVYIQGEPVQDPFRRGLGHAVQWYDRLRSRPEAMVENALDECLKTIYSTDEECHSASPLAFRLPSVLNRLPRLRAPPPRHGQRASSMTCPRILRRRFL